MTKSFAASSAGKTEAILSDIAGEQKSLVLVGKDESPAAVKHAVQCLRRRSLHVYVGYPVNFNAALNALKIAEKGVFVTDYRTAGERQRMD